MSIEQRLRIEISADGLLADLIAVGRHPRRSVKVKELRAYLATRGVRHGVARRLLAEFLKRWRRGRLNGPYRVAQGEPAVTANEGTLKRLHPPPRTGKDPVELLPLFVKKGEAVIAVQNPCPGKAGRDVRGRKIPPPETRPLSLRPGVGLLVRDKIWRARRTGFLVEHEGTVQVTRTLTHLHDLPAAEYDWDGAVEVHGGVPSGTRLRATGNIHITQGVASAVRIDSGGEIVIRGTVTGGGTTELVAENEVRVGALQGVRVLAGGDIQVRGLCEESVCRTRGRFLADSASGRVVGGRVEAVCGAAFLVLGCEAGIRTLVSVGTADWIDEEIQLLERQVRRWKTYYGKLFRDFRERFGNLLEDRSQIYRLGARARRAYESAHDSVLAEQRRVDAKISEVRTQQTRLEKARQRDEEAVIRIEGRAHYGCSLSIRGKLHPVQRGGLAAVTLHVSPGTGRVLPIPTSLMDSSEIRLQH